MSVSIEQQLIEMSSWKHNANRRAIAQRTASLAAPRDSSDPFTYSRVMSQLSNNSATPECFTSKALPLGSAVKPSDMSPYSIGARFYATRKGAVFA